MKKVLYEDSLLIKINNVGFELFVDKRKKHNFITPSLLFLFSSINNNKTLFSDENIRETNILSEDNNMNPFNINDFLLIKHKFHYVGKKLGKCRDNKLRICKVFMLEFEYKECTLSFPFLLDKSLDTPAILGFDYYKRLIKTVITHNKNTKYA